MDRLPRLAAGMLAAFLLAGCSGVFGTGEPASTTPPGAETLTEAESTTGESPGATAPTSTLIQMDLGDTFVTDRGSEITAHEVRLDIPYDLESEEGGAWHAIDVEYCLGDELPELSVFQEFTYGWILRTEEGYVLDYPGSSYDDIIAPQLDLYSVTPVAGECYRGWVLIDGPMDVTVTSARLDELDWTAP